MHTTLTSAAGLNAQTIDDAYNSIIRFIYHIGGGVGFPSFVTITPILTHAQRIVLSLRSAKANTE